MRGEQQVHQVHWTGAVATVASEFRTNDTVPSYSIGYEGVCFIYVGMSCQSLSNNEYDISHINLYINIRKS